MKVHIRNSWKTYLHVCLEFGYFMLIKKYFKSLVLFFALYPANINLVHTSLFDWDFEFLTFLYLKSDFFLSFGNGSKFIFVPVQWQLLDDCKLHSFFPLKLILSENSMVHYSSIEKLPQSKQDKIKISMNWWKKDLDYRIHL